MIRVAILGYGNIGSSAERAIRSVRDLTLTGVFHHDEVEKISAATVDVCLVCTPSRQVPDYVPQLLQKGICTVDSFDIHPQIYDLRMLQMLHAKENNVVSILSAGWDPGSDSIVRALMTALVPDGQLYTTFGPGRSMGHTVAAKHIEGVKDALSMTLPAGKGVHKRHVYIELQEGYDFSQVRQRILEDDYFAHDETVVEQVTSVEQFNTTKHGVMIEREGISSATPNQQLEFKMAIDNPSLTGQMLVGCARACMWFKRRGLYGAYTAIEIPPIALLPGTEEQIIKQLV